MKFYISILFKKNRKSHTRGVCLSHCKEYNHIYTKSKCIKSKHDIKGMLPKAAIQSYKDLNKNSSITKVGHSTPSNFLLQLLCQSVHNIHNEITCQTLATLWQRKCPCQHSRKSITDFGITKTIPNKAKKKRPNICSDRAMEQQMVNRCSIPSIHTKPINYQ